jgi:uncharacterized protein (DUF1778 family)
MKHKRKSTLRKMSSPAQRKIEARLPVGVYAVLKRAAQLVGCNLTDFVVSAAPEAAQRAIEEEGIIELSAEDQRRFAEAFIDPPKPNQALRRAARAHAKLVDVR